MLRDRSSTFSPTRILYFSSFSIRLHSEFDTSMPRCAWSLRMSKKGWRFNDSILFDTNFTFKCFIHTHCNMITNTNNFHKRQYFINHYRVIPLLSNLLFIILSHPSNFSSFLLPCHLEYSNTCVLFRLFWLPFLFFSKKTPHPPFSIYRCNSSWFYFLPSGYPPPSLSFERFHSSKYFYCRCCERDFLPLQVWQVCYA